MVSDTESQQSVWLVDGITSRANEPVWIVDGSSLQVDIGAPSLEGSTDMLQFESLLVTALDQVVESGVVIATPSSSKMVNTTAGIALFMRKQSDSTVAPGFVAIIVVVALLSVLLLGAGVLGLVWCLRARRFRKVNAFKRNMTSFKSWENKRKIAVSAKMMIKGPSSKTLIPPQ